MTNDIFHVSVGYIYISLWEVSVQMSCPFFRVDCLLLSYRNSFCILATSLLSDKCFVNILSQSVAECFFVVGAILYIVGCLAASVASAHEIPVVSPKLWQPKMSLNIAILLPNQTWVHSLGCGEGKCSLYYKAKQGVRGGKCSKDLNSPMAFRERFLKTGWGRGLQVHDQLVDILLIG